MAYMGLAETQQIAEKLIIQSIKSGLRTKGDHAICSIVIAGDDGYKLMKRLFRPFLDDIKGSKTQTAEEYLDIIRKVICTVSMKNVAYKCFMTDSHWTWILPNSPRHSSSTSKQ